MARSLSFRAICYFIKLCDWYTRYIVQSTDRPNVCCGHDSHFIEFMDFLRLEIEWKWIACIELGNWTYMMNERTVAWCCSVTLCFEWIDEHSWKLPRNHLQLPLIYCFYAQVFAFIVESLRMKDRKRADPFQADVINHFKVFLPRKSILWHVIWGYDWGGMRPSSNNHKTFAKDRQGVQVTTTTNSSSELICCSYRWQITNELSTSIAFFNPIQREWSWSEACWP